MRWEDERYVRIYTRDTPSWMLLSWDAQALFLQLLRKCDRAGIVDLGRHGARAIAVLVGRPQLWEPQLRAALEELIAECCVLCDDAGEHLVIPGFIEAQETMQSDRLRQRESRERRRDLIRAGLRPDSRRSIVYFLQADYGGPVKIGYTDDLARMIANLQSSRAESIVVLAVMDGGVSAERELHSRFAVHHIRGEWYSPADDLMEFIKGLKSLHDVTKRDMSQNVTCHTRPSDVTVTPSLAVPSCTVLEKNCAPMADVASGNAAVSSAAVSNAETGAMAMAPGSIPAGEHVSGGDRGRKVSGDEYKGFVGGFTDLFRSRMGASPGWDGVTGKMAKALLRKAGSADSATLEALRRAGIMLDMAGTWPAKHPDLQTLLSHWDKFVAPARNVRVGHVRAEDQTHTGPNGIREDF